MPSAEVLWRPTPQRVARSRMHQFMQQMSARHGFEAEWPALHRWSVEHPDQFWQEMLQSAGIEPTHPAERVLQGAGLLDRRWFPGMELNYAAHMLRHDTERCAIHAADETGRQQLLTYRELRVQVAACVRGLQAAGVGRGDRVAGFIPNIPEAVVAMLASATIGAVWSSCSPDFGINGVVDRFGQIEPKVLFTADGYSYNGRRIDSLDRVRHVMERIPSIERVVVIGFVDRAPDLQGLKRAQSWAEFVQDGPADLPFASLPFDHPLFIMYSSGTTGVPKCIVHGHGGTLLQHMKELTLHCDVGADDVVFYFTTCGWMMWNWVVSSLGAGATLVLYEGSPSHPDLHRLWNLAEQTAMTVLGSSPKFISACTTAGLRPGAEHDLSALRCILSTGSPLAAEQFRWVYGHVKRDLQLSSICGGTDIISCFMLGNPMLPVRAGEIQCLGLGMNVQAYGDQARPVVGQKGELVCVTPFPSQPVGFWNDADGQKYRQAYFDHYPGVWRHGDFIELTPHGGVIVYGRSDATLNPGGIRIGTAEIYRLVESLEEVTDSVVVGREVSGDVEICLFVVLKPGLTLDQKLIDRIKNHIAAGATRRHVPRHIRQVSAVPYTISGKKVELAVSDMIHGRAVQNRHALANPQALDEYAGIV